MKKRIKAAKKAADAGYEVRFRFDPIIPIGDWRRHYGEMVEKALTGVQPSVITLGTYRPHPALHARILKAFPDDGFNMLNLRKNGKKMYYPDEERVEIYGYMIDLISRFAPNARIGLCKETSKTWRELRMNAKKISCNCLL